MALSLYHSLSPTVKWAWVLVSLKKHRISSTNILRLGRSVLHEERKSIKKREKQKREAMHNLYYLTDIALYTFESRKAELKIMVKMRFGLYIYDFIFSPN